MDTITPNSRQPDGITFEHVLLSVTIAHNRSIGQFDDSMARSLEKTFAEYQGVASVEAQALYKHGKSEQHVSECSCGMCVSARHEADLPYSKP